MRFTVLPVVSVVALLTGCGGGGGGSEGSAPGGASTPATYMQYNTNDTRIKTTVSHSVGAEASITAITSAVDASVPPSSGATTLSSYTLDNGVNAMAIDTTGISSLGLYTHSAGSRVAYIGGTTWSHSRYGFYVDKTSNSNGANTQYVVRNMPFVYVNQYNSPVLSNATYSNSKAVGTYVTENSSWQTVTCDVSAAFSVSGTAQTTDISLSGCKDSNNVSVPTAGFVRATKPSNANGFATSTNGTTPFTSTSAGSAFTLSSVSIYYRLGGPNAEEMVGTVFMTGTTTIGATSRPTQITFAFGAKK